MFEAADLRKALQAAQPHVKAMMLLGINSGYEDKRQSQAAGCNAHLVKPVDAAHCAACWPFQQLSRLTDQRKQQRCGSAICC